MKHVAYNLETGEVITTNRVNHLKRCVKQCNRWNVVNNYPVGKWLFAHNNQGMKRIKEKIHAHAAS
jgi:hypothetical protein